MSVIIRYFLDKDFDEVLKIEKSSFEFPWNKHDFLCCIRTPYNRLYPKCFGFVAKSNKLISGYLIYEEYDKALRIINVAVDEKQRRLGIFTELSNKLVSIAIKKNKPKIVLEVRETNLQAQLAFKSVGFKAVKILKNQYCDSAEDAYRMVFKPKCRILQAWR